MALDTKRLNDLTTEISKELQRLHYDIMKTIEVFEKRREIVEKHCGQCRDIFKPWPNKVVRLYRPDAEIDEKSDETNEKLNFDSPNPHCERQRQELAMLDDILAKAHHARDLQNKMSKPSKKSHSAKFKSPNLPTSQVKEEKPKPKVSYPVLRRPPSARSTYATSYKKPVRCKTQGAGTERNAASTSRTTVASSKQELRKPPPQDKTSEHKYDETKKITAKSISTSGQIENKLPSKPKSSENKKSQPNSTADARFLVSEQGSTLSMPNEFQRIYKEHKKLQRRLRKARTAKQLQSQEQFVKKVEENFCPKLQNFPGVLRAREDARGLEKKYKELLSFVRAMVLRGPIDGSSDSVKCWENVMSTLMQLNEEAKMLKENLGFLAQHCPLPEHKSVEFGEQENLRDTAASSSIRRKYSKKTNTDGYFTYHNMKELKTFLQMSHDYKIMTCQLDLRLMLGETILPLLQLLPTKHRSFVPLCRSVYSILCCEGKTFPTVVKDSVPED